MKFFKIPDFMRDLDPTKFCLKEFFGSTAAQPQPPAHTSQRSDGRISKTIVRIQSSKPKRNENARKFCSPNFCFEAPATQTLLDGGNLTVSTSHIQLEMATAAPQGIEIASASEFCDFTAREGSPAARYHEIFEISNFAPDLDSRKFCF